MLNFVIYERANLFNTAADEAADPFESRFGIFTTNIDYMLNLVGYHNLIGF